MPTISVAVNNALLDAQRLKVNAIRIVRQLTDCGLKEAKDLIDNTFNGKPVLFDVNLRAVAGKTDFAGRPITLEGLILDFNKTGWIATVVEDSLPATLLEAVEIAIKSRKYLTASQLLIILAEMQNMK